jgi:hypothetical protein
VGSRLKFERRETCVYELAEIEEYQWQPDIALNKSQMPGIKMSHKESIISENNRGEEGAHFIDSERADKKVHKYGAEHAVQYDCVTVSILCGHDIKEKTEWIKQGCLNVCDKRRAR